jgi:3-hydroxyisobutyrate dehydrogenase-like beta-hydroxyacid dehydrogenase
MDGTHMKVAFIGTGRMGAAMARNLVAARHEVTVYNRTREKAEGLGARVAASPAEACRDCEAAFTMLADDAAVEHSVLGPDGVAEGLAPGAAHISSSTIGTALARRLFAEHAGRGQAYLSAPVFGRPEAAEARKLLVVAGGTTEAIGRFQPLFDAIGRQTFVAGAEPWQANALKLCGNFMIASMIESFGEAYGTLRKAQVDPHLFLDVMSALFGSPVYANYGRIIADGKFDPAGFALRLGLKDIRLLLETAFECTSAMPIASVLRDRLVDALGHGQGEKDWSSVALWGR